MAFRGVRSSWETVARKSSFALFCAVGVAARVLLRLVELCIGRPRSRRGARILPRTQGRLRYDADPILKIRMSWRRGCDRVRSENDHGRFCVKVSQESEVDPHSWRPRPGLPRAPRNRARTHPYGRRAASPTENRGSRKAHPEILHEHDFCRIDVRDRDLFHRLSVIRDHVDRAPIGELRHGRAERGWTTFSVRPTRLPELDSLLRETPPVRLQSPDRNVAKNQNHSSEGALVVANRCAAVVG